MSPTLFEKYGGYDTFSTVVSNFYQKILDSEELQGYFDGIDMFTLMEHQTQFISKALGGPDKYEGTDLKQAHSGLNITLPHFQRVTELLTESLDEAGVAENDIKTIISVIANLQDQIVAD